MFASAHRITRTIAGAAGALLFAGLAVGAATTPAAAQIRYGINEAGQQVAAVSFADLDLDTKAGRNRLDARVRIAARNVCNSGQRGVWGAADDISCFKKAYDATRTATMAAIAVNNIGG